MGPDPRTAERESRRPSRLYDAVDSVFARTAGWKGSLPTHSALQWNFLPSLAVLLAVLLLWRRAPFAAIVAAALLSRVPLLFLAAPAAQFKYYYAMHMGGIIVLGILLAHVPWRDVGPRLAALLPPSDTLAPARVSKKRQRR